jgi:long-chain fatty acid transport protein
LADYHVVRWSRFESIVIDFENALTPTRTLYASYEDTDGFRFGADWAHSDKLSLRAGYLSHTAAAPPQTVTPLLPEGHRNEVSFGVGLRLGATLHADAAYQYVFQNDRRGRVREPADGSPPTTALNSGVYEFGAHLFAVTLVLTF